jgi:hypothetical protein
MPRRPTYDENRDWIIVYSTIPQPDKEEAPPIRRRAFSKRQPRYPWDSTRDNVIRDLYPIYFAKDVAKVLNTFWPEPCSVTANMVIVRAERLGVQTGRLSSKRRPR